MTMRRACLVLVLAFFLVPSVNAFKVTRASGTSGPELKWPVRSVSYKANTSYGPSGTDTAISAAMATWNSVSGADFQFHHAGVSALRGAVYDGQNVCSFGSIDDEDTLARNSFWFNPETGVISESDIVFNTAFGWTVIGESGKYDLQSVATHELGHTLSLDDLYGSGDVEKTMYGKTSAGETQQRSLHADDMAGIVYLYPGYLPDLVPHQQAGWSSPVVVSKVTGTFNDDYPLNAADTLYVDLSVKNQGAGNVMQQFYLDLYVDGNLKKSWSVSPPMNAGFVSEATDYVIGSLSAGTHTIKIVTDSGSAVSETDESNNTFTKTITVLNAPVGANLAPYKPAGWPEKIVVSKTEGTFTHDAPFYTTDALYLDWAVKNEGEAGTTARFYTELYLDNVLVYTWYTDPSVDPGYLAKGLDFQLGLLSAGTHTVKIKTDTTGSVAESDETDNEYTQTLTVLNVPVGANLAPYKPAGWPEKIVVSKTEGTFTHDTPFYTTDALYLDWAVKNEGEAGTTARFYTELYLDNVLVYTWYTDPSLDPGYLAKGLDFRLGPLNAGTHTVKIKTDTTGSVAESDETDNEYTQTFKVYSTVDSPTFTVGVQSEFGPLPGSVNQVGVLSGKVTSGTLPPGIKIVVKDNGLYVTGVPTKAGNYNVSVQPLVQSGGVTSPGEAVALDIEVVALDNMATGAFNGWLSGGARGHGLAQMTISALGKITGKLSVGGTNYAFSATSFGNVTNGTFNVQVLAKSAKAAFPLWIAVSSDGLATGVLPDEPASSVVLYRNVWKDAGMAAVADNYDGYYTATLPSVGDCGSGYLTFTVDKAGMVRTAGKLADGTAVSLSGLLILNEKGHVFAIVYTAPVAYKGGSLFGLAEFVNPADGAVYMRLLDGVKFVWKSRNPLATGDHGAGFSRSLGMTGGRYDKLINLYNYYENGLIIGDTALPELPISITFTDWVDDSQTTKEMWTETGYAAEPVGGDSLPTGLGLSLNMAGTGFAAPKADLPVKDPETGEYSYGEDTNGDGVFNTSGLTFTFTKATGLFKGSFKAWYDYTSAIDNTTDTGKFAHASKTVAFLGALTPIREKLDDGIGGRSYFLWPEKGSYTSASGKSMTYSFNVSYDFLLLAD